MDARRTIFPGSQEWPKNQRYLTRRQPTNPHDQSSEPMNLRVIHEAPWDLYARYINLELGKSVDIIYTKDDEVYSCRCLREADCEKIDMLRKISHPNILHSHQIFLRDGLYYVVSELAAISLEDLLLARPDEIQIRAIMHQVSEDYLIYRAYWLISRLWLACPISNPGVCLTRPSTARISCSWQEAMLN
jgi:hypothetical protein